MGSEENGEKNWGDDWTKWEFYATLYVSFVSFLPISPIQGESL